MFQEALNHLVATYTREELDQFSMDHWKEVLYPEWDENDVNVLINMVLGHVMPERDISKVDPVDLSDMIKESIHEGLDGWDDREHAVIMAYLSDIAWAVHQSKKM